MKNEILWNTDLINILTNELIDDYPKIKIIKGKVLKDIFLIKDQHTQKNKLQFGFVDQDIVIYDEEMDIKEFHKLNNIKVHNNKEAPKKMIIPKIIIELKYNGINSHGLITYSDYASDIKSIFPDCKYWLSMRYRKTCSVNKLKRHGKNFDKIIYFSDSKSEGEYKKGSFKLELENSKELKERFNEFIQELKGTLKETISFFVK